MKLTIPGAVQEMKIWCLLNCWSLVLLTCRDASGKHLLPTLTQVQNTCDIDGGRDASGKHLLPTLTQVENTCAIDDTVPRQTGDQISTASP